MARRYARDNRGRFASVGATARGGRLATASGNKRATQTKSISGGKLGNIVDKPKGIKPQSSRSLRTGIAINRQRAINAKMGNQPDIAQQHIPGRFRGQAGKKLEASIDRAVKQVKAAQTAQWMKPKVQTKAERAARAETKKAADAAKPKRTPTAESLRVSRAKQIEKRRGMNISNPAAWRDDSAGRMAANAARTQERALAFYKSGDKSSSSSPNSFAANKVEMAKGRSAVLSKQKDSLNKQLKEINAKIKAAGPSAGNLRLQKLQIQDRLSQTRLVLSQSKAATK